MSEPKPSNIAEKTYEIEAILVEYTNGEDRKVIRDELLGRFSSWEEAVTMLELIELPNDFTVI